jgi:hypothetical protein
MTRDLFARANAVIDAKHNKTAARKRGALDTAILGTVPILAIATAFASGWSLYDLGRHFHMPGWAAWAVFALIDVVWFQSAIVVIKNQDSPHRAIEAHQRMQRMFAVSVAANFTHGLILFGLTVNGFVAGAVFALFPIGFKAAFSNAFPDYVKRARKSGYGAELDRAFHTEILMRVMSGVDQAKTELAGPPLVAHAVVREQEPTPLPTSPPGPVKPQPALEPAGPVGEEIEDIDDLLTHAHAPVVYFLRNGTRVKIGTTRNLRSRIARLALRPDNVMRVEHGGQDHEQSLHARFNEHRVGNTEWFELRAELADYLGEPEAQPLELTAQFIEPAAHTAEPVPAGGGLSTVSTQASTPEPTAPHAEPEAPSFGFSAHLTGQAAQRAKAVAQVAELLAQDRGITSEQVKEELGVSLATAKRYLREARQAQ